MLTLDPTHRALATEPMLSIEGLYKRYPQRREPALAGIDLEVAPGEVLGLLGPNGAGKTTIVSIVSGLLPADEGRVAIAGREVGGRSSEARRHLGLVPQEVALYGALSARENLRFWGAIYGLAGQALSRRVEEELAAAGLAARGDEPVEILSGGMKRRLNLAAALLHRPGLLLLDEPTVGVDPQSRSHLLDHVRELAAAGTAVVYSTHYLEEAERLCDRVAILDEGRIVATGTPRDLIDHLGGGTISLELAAAAGAVPEALVEGVRGLAGVRRLERSERRLDLTAQPAGRVLPGLVDLLGRMRLPLAALELREASLESVFLGLTGKRLRDA